MEILVGKKKAFVYKNMCIYTLQEKQNITMKARGRSILTAIDALEILKREICQRYPNWELDCEIKSDSSEVPRREQDSVRGDKINISELEIIIKRT